MQRVLLIIVFLSVSNTLAQSGRVIPANSAGSPDAAAKAGDEKSIKQMFDEVNAYSRTKFAEFEEKKLAYSEQLRIRTEHEQKQMAAKYAGTAALRKLEGDDLYYLGLLHWIAENMDGTAENLGKFIESGSASEGKTQTARSIVAIAFAKLGRLDDAERLLAAYLDNEPVKPNESGRMESEIAKAYIAAREFARAAPHAELAYRLAKVNLLEPGARSRSYDEIIDSGLLVFESHRDAGNVKAADDALEDLRKTAVSVGSTTLYFYASDKLITHRIETGRKPFALETFSSILLQAVRDFPAKAPQTDVIQRLKKREKHYKLLAEPAFEMTGIDKWFPGQPRTMLSLRGKVILLDFWATWCGPCFDAFPHLAEWKRDLEPDGLVILGVTRYYGQADGLPADASREFEFLKRFREKEKLPYDIVVAADQQSQIQYGATALPTAVLIDRKGIIRFIEPGTSPARLEEMRAMILKLLAEK